MNAEALLDTNVLLYAVSTARNERAKRDRARELLVSRAVGFSTQVFAEFYVNATRKRFPRLKHEEAVAILAPLKALPVQPLTLEVVWAAFAVRDLHGISYWDAAIIGAAQLLGCKTVWSEDLNDGQDYGGVVVLNPFLE
jgi:predicted nucleic acid-binding protein